MKSSESKEGNEREKREHKIDETKSWIRWQTDTKRISEYIKYESTKLPDEKRKIIRLEEKANNEWHRKY